MRKPVFRNPGVTDDLTYRVTLVKLLREAKEQHTLAEGRLAFDHDWEDWYAAYVTARVYGLSVREANNAADDDLRAAHAVQLSLP